MWPGMSGICLKAPQGNWYNKVVAVFLVLFFDRDNLKQYIKADDHEKIKCSLLNCPCFIFTKNRLEMKASNTQVQMRKGILEFCILHIISRGEVYASDMLEELTEAKLIVVEGTLYPLLNRLRTAALVSYKWVESESGPPRKYYSITAEGSAFLDQLESTWDELVRSTTQITSKN